MGKQDEGMDKMVQVLNQYKQDSSFREALRDLPRGMKIMGVLLGQFAMLGDIVMVRDLIDRGADVNAKPFEKTPLWFAASINSIAIIQVLLDNGAHIDLRDKSGVTPLIRAVEEGHLESVKLLIEHGADVNVKDKTGRTTVLWSCMSGNELIISALIQAGADPTNTYGESALRWVIVEGTPRILKLLLGAKFTTPKQKKDLEASLLIASESGKTEAVEELLRFGVDPNTKLFGITALHHVSHTQHVQVAKLLIEAGADPNMDEKKTKKTPLHIASESGQTGLAETLIDSGARVSCETADAETPLFLACKAGHTEMVRLLVKKGADIHTSNKRRVTPLFAAAEAGNLELVRILIDSGAEFNASEGRGMTLLEWAIRQKNAKLVHILAEAGADVNATADEDGSLLELAARNGSKEIEDILKSHGARIREDLDEDNNATTLIIPEISTSALEGEFHTALMLVEKLKTDEAKAVNCQLILNAAAERNDKGVVESVVQQCQTLDLKPAFLTAVEKGFREILSTLINQALKWTDMLSGLPLGEGLKTAVRKGDRQTFEILMGHYSRSERDSDLFDELLAAAVFNSHFHLVKQLLERGFGQNDRKLTWAGMRVLHRAVEDGDTKTIDVLLKEGSLTVEKLANSEDSIMVILAKRNDIELAKRLIDRGLDLNAAGDKGMTALMWAAKDNHSRMASLLLFKGADVALVDEKGRTALDYAISQNRFDIIKLLKASSAKRGTNTD